MRKILLPIVFLFVLTSFSAHSQFSQGDKVVGGAVNVYSGSYNSTYFPNPQVSSSSFNTGLAPRFSWVTGKNMMNGIIINGFYSHSKSENPDPNQYTVTTSNYSFGAGYFLRHFKDFAQQFGWFMDYSALGSYNVSKQKNVAIQSSSESKSTGFTAGINVVPGVYYKVSTRAVIEAGFGGVGATYGKSTSGPAKYSSFNIGFNFPSNFTFGMQFLLGNKAGSK